MDKLMMALYQVISLATFIYLNIVDWNTTHGAISFFICFSINIFLAEIWPIYWGILHWLL